MRRFVGYISTSKIGSECTFEFEVDDDASEEEIEREARETAFNLIDWSYHETDTPSKGGEG